MWSSDGVDPVTLTQNQQAGTELLTGIITNIKNGSTVERIVGTWGMRPVSSDALTVCKMGILMMDEDAFSAGAFPELDVDDPAWLYLNTLETYTGDIAANPSQLVTRDVNIKARRRYRSTAQKLIVIIENITSIASSLITLWNFRTLLKVP